MILNFPLQQHLLHIAARQPAYRRKQIGCGDVQLLYHPGAVLNGRFFIQEEAACALEGTEHHVFGHSHGGNQPHAQAILGHIGNMNARAINRQRIHSLDFLAARRDDAVFRHGDACQRVAQLLLATAGDACNAENLSRIGVKRKVFDAFRAGYAAHREVAHRKIGLYFAALGAIQGELRRIAHHIRGKLVGRNGLHIQLLNEFSLAQNRHLVGHGKKLVDLVADKHHAFAFVLHAAQHIKQAVSFLRGKHRGRLIQDQYFRAAIERLDDFHRLLFRNRHFGDFPVWIDMKAVLVNHCADFRAHLSAIKQNAALLTQDNVLRGAEHIHQHKMLMNHADAQLVRCFGRINHSLIAIHPNFAVVRLINARQHVHQRGFAAAVFSQQRMNFAPFQPQIHIVVCNYPAKGFAAMLHLNRVFRCMYGFHPA